MVGDIAIPHHIYGPDVVDTLRYPSKGSKKPFKLIPGNCDLIPILFWKSHPQYQHVWVMEDDVEYTGDPAQLFADLAGKDEDLLATHVTQCVDDWIYAKNFRSPGVAVQGKVKMRQGARQPRRQRLECALTFNHPITTIMNQLIQTACLALLGAAGAPVLAAGQSADAQPQTGTVATAAVKPAPAAQAAPVAQVSVTGTRANDTEQRRLSTASTMMFGREELDRSGDTNIGDILKRLPGVTMGGPPRSRRRRRRACACAAWATATPRCWSTASASRPASRSNRCRRSRSSASK